MVTCAICERQFNYISNTHLKKHGISQQEYLLRYKTPLKSEEYKRKAYRHHSEIMSRLRRTGVVKPPSPTLEQRLAISQRMKEKNPMKNPETARKVAIQLKGRKSYERNIKHRLNQSDLKIGVKNPRYKGGKRKKYHLTLWSKTRRLVLERDSYKCTVCGMTNDEHKQLFGKGLEVNHKIPLLESHDYSLENLITLCHKHHLEADKKYREEQALGVTNSPSKNKTGGSMTLLGQDASGIHFLVTLDD